ncbi:hypothetical protein C7W93_19880 [Glaciimonas sp. PCH181]|nr:hypothetical protein C7W93_19880 [Glaciimonas sp. PCH181]
MPPDADLIGYIQTQQKDLQNGIPYTATADFSRIPATTNVPSPIPTANCGGGAADCVAGIAPPRTQAERDAKRNQGADLAGNISSQAGRFAAAATAYGAYLASQPNAAGQAAAGIQLGMAGTATVVGFGASAVEQLLRPNTGQYLYENTFDLGVGKITIKFPIASPVLIVGGEVIKNSGYSPDIKNWLNSRWESIRKSVEGNE